MIETLLIIIAITLVFILAVTSTRKMPPIMVEAKEVKSGEKVYVRMIESKPNENGGYWYEMVWRKGVVFNLEFDLDVIIYHVAVEGYNEPVLLHAKDLFVKK